MSLNPREALRPVRNEHESRVHRRDPRGVRRIFIDGTIASVGGAPRGSGPPSSLTSIDAYLFIGRLVRKYGGIPIYTDGAGWYADACRRAPSARSTIAP
ncbi:MAG: hypothetical protein RXR82_07235 [Nitrososphaeria archaeon]